jgi:hypothetical protein
VFVCRCGCSGVVHRLQLDPSEKTPFCNACRRLVMDRVTMFLVFHPHPAIHQDAHQLFADTVRTQYKTERYRSRKMSAEWCANCRDPDSRLPRSSIDRFVIMSHASQPHCTQHTAHRVPLPTFMCPALAGLGRVRAAATAFRCVRACARVSVSLLCVCVRVRAQGWGTRVVSTKQILIRSGYSGDPTSVHVFTGSTCCGRTT